MKHFSIFLLALLLSATALQAQTVRYVKSIASGSGNGTSWANASDNLQAMIDASSVNDQVWVAAGTYIPTALPPGCTDCTNVGDVFPNPRDVTFFIKDGVKIYGGFAGTETTLSQRTTAVIAANPTILSGNIGNPNIPEDNCYRVVLAIAPSTGGIGVTIDGFTITAGRATPNVFNLPSLWITVNGTRIRRGEASGIMLIRGTNTISNNTIHGNQGNGDFGAVHIIGGTTTINRNTIYGNHGGIRVNMVAGNSCTITNNSLYGNSVATSVVAIHGGTSNFTNNAVFNNNIFDQAVWVSGAVYLHGVGGPAITADQIFVPVQFESVRTGGNHTIMNNTIYNNSGSGIYTSTVQDDMGGLLETHVIIRNNILWNNSTFCGINCPGADFWTNHGNPATYTVQNNILQLAAADYNPFNFARPNNLGPGDTGNIFATDPVFLDPSNPAGPDGIHRTSDDGLRLQTGSPAINAGTPTGAPSTDITGANRTGNPDIGAYEGGVSFCPTLTTAPANVTITNSTCPTGCTPTGGDITAPTGTPCPAGSTLQYRVGSGSWTTTLPTYGQSGPAQTISTRCVCNTDSDVFSPESTSETTIPGTCTNCIIDCAGVPNGTAFLDNCGTCVGGNTGLTACVQDCNGDFGGTAFTDNCGICVGGNTGLTACVQDCNGDFGGTAFLDGCGICVGGNTGLTACVQDCNGDFGGTAFLDNCGTCVGGNTGLTACVQDCNGDFGGTAFLDGCGICVEGNTGLTACVPPACNTYASAANLNLAIPDNNATGISSTINVPATGTITELVCVTVNIQHTYVGDLVIKLAHNGTEVQLIRRTGATSAGSFGDSSNLDGNYTFCATGNDFAAAAAAAVGSGDIIATSPPNYQQSSSSLQATPPAIPNTYADFVGLDVNGDWTLTISDHTGIDTGTLRDWSFEVCTGTVLDCNGDLGGTAFTDNCGTCVGGNTGLTACVQDCNGDFGGTAFTDNCGTCVGGNTGLTACVQDCNGDFGGTAFTDNCGTCVGGNTGLTACVPDCNGVFGGTAFLDGCGICVGGNTGLTACIQDCNGDFGGTAFLDNCGTCVEGNTGLTACVPDCNGVFGGTASIDNCGRCTGGNTGIIPNTPITNTTTIACGSYYWSVTGLTYTQSGVYSVTVSDCLIKVLDFTVPPGLAVSLNGNTSVCTNGIIGLTATGGNQYQWSGPNNYTNTGASITRTNANVTMSGTYTVTITNSACVSVLSIMVTVHPTPAATITGGGTAAVCSGGAISLSVPAGAVSYAWSGPGGFTASGATMTRPNATTAMAGTYTVTVTGAGGCTATASRSVSVSAPTTATITGATSFCSSGAVTLTATTAGVSYQWSGPNGFSFSGATMTRTPAVAGTYSVTVTNASGCISTANRTVTLTAAPTVNINNLTNCTRIYLVASGANSYAWSGPNGYAINGHALVRNPATATMWGTYTVTATGTGGCTTTASVTVSPCSGKNAGEELTQNMSVYPNPTGNISNISFYSNKEEAVTLAVFAADGKEVAVLFNQTAQPDTAYSVVFDATQLPNGTYYAVLRHADGSQETLPVLVVK